MRTFFVVGAVALWRDVTIEGVGAETVPFQPPKGDSAGFMLVYDTLEAAERAAKGADVLTIDVQSLPAASRPAGGEGE